MPLRVIITEGSCTDCTQAQDLIKDFPAQHLLADRGYDSNAIIESAQEQGIEPEIPPRKHRIQQRSYDRHLYKIRALVQNAFLHLKRWRGIATRYAKHSASFLAAVQGRCIFLWARII